MRFPVRPGRVTCAGLVAILMVLPSSIWKAPDAKPIMTKKTLSPEAGRRQTHLRSEK
jgi:hypothetical protein